MTARRRGQPLYALTFLLAGWIIARLAAHISLYHPPIPPPVPSEPVMIAAAGFFPAQFGQLGPPPTLLRPVKPGPSTSNQSSQRPRTTPSPDLRIDPLQFLHPVADFTPHDPRHPVPDPAPARLPTPIATPLPTPSAGFDRWSGSGWMLWRPGGSPPDLASIGRLGGSQIGLRIDYRLTQTPRIAAYARATRAFDHPAAPESAIGLALRPSAAIPVSLAIERRIALGDGARDAMAVMAVGGFGPTEIAPRINAESYIQTGLVGFHHRDAFIDGKFSLSTPVQHDITIGAAISGGAQPGVERLDIGPELQLRLPLPRAAARLSVEWRQRILGHAAPVSGLAITLASDF